MPESESSMEIKGFSDIKYTDEQRRINTVKQLYGLFLSRQESILEQAKALKLIDKQVFYLRKLAGETQKY